MAMKIRLKFGTTETTAVLNDSETARQFNAKLPMQVSMTRWGDEYYGGCGIRVQPSKDARAQMDLGELAIWPQGSALCIFFGPTPASTDERPRAISPVNPIGVLEGDIEFLKKLPTSVNVEIESWEP
jgi:hypothetical protein